MNRRRLLALAFAPFLAATPRTAEAGGDCPVCGGDRFGKVMDVRRREASPFPDEIEACRRCGTLSVARLRALVKEG